MELQWPLILFTTFVAWSAGLFAVQGIYALKGEAEKAQMPSLITSLVLLVVGGVAVFFHLQHWERIFNGFGHITSGITQELIAIVALVVVMVVYFAMLRRNDNKVPAAVAWVAIILSIVLIIVAGHSYMMPSRPAWDSVFEPLALIGGGAALGAGTFAFIEAATEGTSSEKTARLNVIGAWTCLVTAVLYVAAIVASSSSFVDLGTTLDPTHPARAMVEAGAYSPLYDGNVPATVVAIVAAALAVVFAYVGKKKGNWKAFGLLVAVCALASAIALRIVFYQTGGSVFMLY